MNSMTPELLRETEQYLHQQIPLTQAMGVRLEMEGERLVVTAPLEPNHNHLGTAFGGSLSAIATLAGYVQLWLMLEDRTAHVVVRESHIQYRVPVRHSIRALCQPPDATLLAGFRQHFEQKGKARLQLSVVVEENGQTCVEFTGEFVAIRG